MSHISSLWNTIATRLAGSLKRVPVRLNTLLYSATAVFNQTELLTIMRICHAVIGCLIDPLVIAAETTVPQPFGINFDDKRQQLQQKTEPIDCRVLISAPLCRYQPVAHSGLMYYEVQYTAISSSIASVMGTTKPFADSFQCQNEMFQINQLIRDNYQLTTADRDLNSIVYEQPSISMT